MQVAPVGLPANIPISSVFVQCSTNYGDLMQTPVSLTEAGYLKMPQLRANIELLRLSCFSPQGEVWFSKAVELDLTDGRERKINVPMQPAVSLTGKLDDSVPRPVKNGVVQAFVIERFEKDTERYNKSTMMYWREWAEIQPDGTFVFENMPVGDVQVIALCDGFIAETGKAPLQLGKVNTRQHLRPQVFEMYQPENDIVIDMQPTGEVAVTVVDQSGSPVPDLKLFSSPNVGWWRGGNMIYCFPLDSTTESLLTSKKKGWDLENHPFQAKTDASGQAVFSNMPVGSQGISVIEDHWRIAKNAGEQNQPWRRKVEIDADQQAELNIIVEPKEKTE